MHDNDAVQVLPVQLSPEIAAHFGGRVPHITVSYAAGARAKEAGECPLVIVSYIWHRSRNMEPQAIVSHKEQHGICRRPVGRGVQRL